MDFHKTARELYPHRYDKQNNCYRTEEPTIGEVATALKKAYEQGRVDAKKGGVHFSE